MQGLPLAVTVLAASLSLSPVRAATSASLSGPEVTKLSWSVRALRAADLDGDGLMDLAVLDNEAARILLLHQMKDPADGDRPHAADPEAQPEDGRFRIERILTGSRMYDLAIGDLDGDGRLDLVTTGTPEGLVLRTQGAKGFEVERSFPAVDPVAWTDSLLVDDLDGDGDDDLVVLDESAVLIFLQQDGTLVGPERTPLGETRAVSPRLDDLDGDGIVDLRYQAARSQWPLRYRLGRGDGTFGPERSFELAPVRGPVVVSSTAPLRFAALDVGTGVVTISGLVAKPNELRRGKSDFGLRLQSQIIATGHQGNDSLWARGDVDGDGNDDLAVASNDRAEVLLISQPSPGRLADPVAFPALDDPIALIAADTDGDGIDELVIASAKDRQVAIMTLDESGRLSFPSPLELEGKPLAVTAADLDDDGLDELIVALDDGESTISLLDWQDDAWQESILASGIDVKALRAIDLDQDGRLDLALILRSKPLRVMLQLDDGSFSLQDLQGASVRGSASSISVGDIDGDGLDEMLVAGSGHARALRWGSAGFEVVDQLNSRAGETELAAATVIDLDGDGSLEALLIPKGGGAVEVLRRDRRGVWRFEAALKAGPLDLSGIDRTDLDSDGTTDLLLYGDGRLLWVAIGADDLELESVATWNPDDADTEREMEAHLLGAGDLDGDGSFELIVVDTDSSRILTLLDLEGDRLKSHLSFPVFEADPHYRGPTGAANEPRELLVADLTGDGLADVVLLVHDRLLLYPSN